MSPESSKRHAMRGRVLFRVRAGEDPQGIPDHGAVAHGVAHALMRFDGGAVERVLRRFSPAMTLSRVFPPASFGGRIGGHGDQSWDDLEVTTGMSRTFRADLDPDVDLRALVDALASLEAVEMASPHYLTELPPPVALDAFGQATAAAGRGRGDGFYGYDLIGAREALRREPGDTALIVAVVDSGVDLEHPEFEGRLRPGVDAVHLPLERVTRGVKIHRGHGKRGEPRDDMGHGTACAGIIGARGRRVSAGLAGAARLLPVRALVGARVVGREGLTAIGAIPDIDAGLKRAVDLGARVLNLSFGTPESALEPGDPPPHAEIVRYALARGCILVAASGNTGDHVRYFPAAIPGVVAVGSVGKDAAPSRFTSRGEHVAVMAPGENVPSVAIGGYHRNSGTSFAAPFVAAACALLVARAARASRPLDAAIARRILQRAARPFGKAVDGEGCGAGILDVPRALSLLEQLLDADAADPRASDLALGSSSNGKVRHEAA
jgi:subtilisin family serine protease